MNILVCLKMVSRSSYTDSFDTDAPAERLSGGVYDVNPADEYALETALRIKDRYGACVTVLSMSPASAEPMLRKALAMGADQAVLICDRLFAGSDTVATSYVLAAALERLPMQDIVFCGNKAIDSETGHIGPQLAAIRGIPCLSNVVSVEDYRGGELYVKRSGGKGISRYAVKLPAVFTLVNGTGMVRSPTILGLRRSAKAEICRLTGADLGYTPLNAGPKASGTETVRVETMSFAHRLGVIESGEEAGAEKLFDILVQKT